MKYRCPVCGYDALSDPPRDYMVCPCCGTEFGYHDLVHSWEDLRSRWLAKGAPWFSKHLTAPTGWDPNVQLAAAGFTVAEVDTMKASK
jgi:hypothetical protein